MSIISALAFVVVALIISAYIVSAIRPNHPHTRDEHEDL